MKKEWAFPAGLALGAAYLALAVLYRLADFPGVHPDEAWVGMEAQTGLRQGFASPHGMHRYTGALHAWVVARSFAWLDHGVFALRLPGALLNALAAAALLAHFHLTLGPAAAAAWLLLLGSSAMFLWKARLAWEVYALQWPLLGALVALTHVFLERGRYTPQWVLAFMAAVYLGVVNHFIFASAPLSLALACLLLLALRADWRFLPFARLCGCALALAAAVVLLKPLVSPEAWRAHPAAFAVLTALPPAAASWLFFALGPRFDSGLRDWVVLRFRPEGAGRLALLGTTLLGVAAFFIWHLAPLVQALSGVAVFMRMASWQPPGWLALALQAWAALLAGAALAWGLKALDPGERLGLGPRETLLALWPAALAAVFIVFRHTSSLRYYAIPVLLVYASLVVALPRLWERWGRALAAPALCFALAVNAALWREMSRPGDRAPIEFRLGWRRERSRDFLRKDPLYFVLESEGACRTLNQEPMLDLPLYFHARTREMHCVPGRALDARYSQAPPYFEWRVLDGVH